MKFSPHAEGGVRAYQPKRRLAELDMEILSCLLGAIIFLGGVYIAAFALSRILSVDAAMAIFAFVGVMGLPVVMLGCTAGALMVVGGLVGLFIAVFILDEEGGSL